MVELTPGLYGHFKKQQYRVFGVATHSETEEPLVIYQPLYGEGKLWVRPLDNFLSTVTIDGQAQPRFKLIQPMDAPVPVPLSSVPLPPTSTSKVDR